MEQKAKVADSQMRKYEAWSDFARTFIAKPKVKKLNYCYEPKDLPEGNNLILANHVARADLFFIGTKYKQHIFYVAGENVFRNAFARKFIVNNFGVIVHLRGATSLNTIKLMTKRLRDGGNVCIFPEGTMTFDGRTRKAGYSIAKLAKRSGANLVLCRIEGAYFTQPRWGVTSRKGKIEVIDYVISANELKEMTVEEVSAIIEEKLYADACEIQEKTLMKYSGKDLCKGLECCIYECPECNKISGMTTTSSRLLCGCGFEAEYDEYGYLIDQSGQKHTIAKLCDLQRENLKQNILDARDLGESRLLFTDEFECTTIYLNKKPVKNGKIKVYAYSDRLKYEINGETQELSYADVGGVFVVLRNTLNCVLAGEECSYDLQGDFSSNALKYRDLHEIMKEIEN